MNNTNESNSHSIWETLNIIAQNILAHVNISFDGATRSIRIDIVPADNRIVEADHKMAAEPERLTDKGEIQEKAAPTEPSGQAAQEEQGGLHEN